MPVARGRCLRSPCVFWVPIRVSYQLVAAFRGGAARPLARSLTRGPGHRLHTHLPGKIMIADLLTKAVARALFASLMDLIRQYAESGVACPST